MSRITITSGQNGMGYLHFDFEQKHVVFDRQAAQSSLLTAANKRVDFSAITGIELKAPGMLTGGQAAFIVNSIRYKANNIEVFLFNVDKTNFPHLNLVLKQLSAEIGVAIKGRNGYAATTRNYSGEYTITDAQESRDLTSTECRMRCNVCGRIICFDLKDVEDNMRRINSAKLSAIGGIVGGLSGNYAAGAVSNQTANNQLNSITDFGKCPHCGSRDLTEITDEDTSCGNTQQSVQAPISSADELKKFKELLDMGVITQEEFDQKKKQLLGL